MEDYPNYERIVSWLMENCSPEFSELLMLESPKDILYLSDVQTYELYYLSLTRGGKRSYINMKGLGCRCYEMLQGRSEPCSFCTNHLLVKDQYYVWRHRNQGTGEEYFLRDKLIERNGRPVRMELAMDVSDPERIDSVIQNSMQCQNLLASCIQPLSAELGLREAFLFALERTGDFFGADSGNVYCYDGPLPNTVWSAGPDRPILFGEELSKDGVERWKERLRRQGHRQVILQDVEDIAGENREVYRFLKEMGIFSFCATPIFVGERAAGLFCLCNVRVHQSGLAVLSAVADYLSGQIQREELHQEKEKALFYDSLTGCLNFEGYKLRVERILRNNPERKYSLWYCDLKKFKYINDVFGFDAGNRLLRYWMNYVAADTRSGEAFCRISADQLSFLRWYDSVSELKERFAGVANALAEFPELKEKLFRPELVAGVYLMESAGDRLGLDEMLNRANMAQKSVKELPGSQIGFYSKALRENILREMLLESEMQDSLKRGEFQIYLQPQVPLGSRRAGERLRAEALVRWWRGGRMYALPDEFIGLFERNGSIVDLDYYVMRKACELLQFWRANGLPPLCIAVNVSLLTMRQAGFEDYYCRIKREHGVEDGEIELEFTESIAVQDYELFRNILDRLHAEGFVCAMDDFGTGQSSLNVLQSLKVDVLKLDRLFFAPRGEPERQRIVVAAILSLSRQLHMSTVAEGIEDEAQMEDLRELGCDYVQGFVFSKPLPVREYIAWIEGTGTWK